MTDSGARRSHYETRQQRAVLHTLAQATGFLSAQALHARLRQAGHTIALTTVYRALRTYADSGRVDTTHSATGEQLFHVRSKPGHSHYLLCHVCGDSIPIGACTVEEWAATTAAEHGFTDIHPVIELTGRCPACPTSTAGESRARPRHHGGRGASPEATA
jgi:Fur family ferric uptake transcriptional regulator